MSHPDNLSSTPAPPEDVQLDLASVNTLPFVVLNTGGHVIAKFSTRENAEQYSQQWLGLLAPFDERHETAERTMSAFRRQTAERHAQERAAMSGDPF